MENEFSNYYKIMGLRIAYYRKKCGYTQAELAEKVNISENYLAQIEGPGTDISPSMKVLFRIADVLGVPPGKLLNED